MKYSFSEITRITGKWSWEKRSGHIGEYMCQVFYNNEYIKCLFGNSYKEVVELQKK